MSAEFLCRDSVPWLVEARDVGAVVTSLPDSAEVEMTFGAWENWFVSAVVACMNAASHDSCSIFYQTDRKLNGLCVSKSHLVFEASRIAGVRCLWHKVVLRHQVGAVDLYRPGFSHMIAFSRKLKSGVATADVIGAGKFAYKNAAGASAARFCAEFASRSTCWLVDPFCGRGTFVFAAARQNMQALGIDIDPQQIEFCKKVAF